MGPLAQAWDDRITNLLGRLPRRVVSSIAWLREPSRRPVRIGASILLILGGLLSILPVLGLWMLPLGFALLSEDIPALKAPLERAARWLERHVRSASDRWRGARPRKLPGRDGTGRER